jgi:hypothetical protein
LKNFNSSEELYKHMNSEDNPYQLGIGALRNTSKKVVGIVWDAAFKAGQKAAKKSDKKQRPCECGCGKTIAVSRKLAYLPGHKQASN